MKEGIGSDTILVFFMLCSLQILFLFERKRYRMMDDAA